MNYEFVFLNPIRLCMIIDDLKIPFCLVHIGNHIPHMTWFACEHALVCAFQSN